ncbi:ankyrin repeat domain-containing protein [Stenotrophomonas maltophilia]|uniref:ankyrin repeat domain-containing protein n=1 Tax=Stenotrophomonas maltophilia TaxID=40324 RepID=UPI0015DF6C72|nr:ankyrin repeat domain-containing protein [Stenotrophomonas maltophilia]MBA0233240.1 ankyrin repeat domain-containing protein [Stenotrophomonas maltophilia]MBA0267279.1 ankyrin repeat domain-containing protein [Stenotrophomonas maltophilia]
MFVPKYNRNQTKRFIEAIRSIDVETAQDALKNKAEPSPLFKQCDDRLVAQFAVAANEVEPHNQCTHVDPNAALMKDTYKPGSPITFNGLAEKAIFATDKGMAVVVGRDRYVNGTVMALFDMFSSIMSEGTEHFTSAQEQKIGAAKAIVNLCMDHGVNMVGKDERGMTLLHWCCALYDDDALITRMLNTGAPAKLQDLDGYTAIEVASHYGHVKSFEALMRFEKQQPAPQADPIGVDILEPCNGVECVQTSIGKPSRGLKRFIELLIGR